MKKAIVLAEDIFPGPKMGKKKREWVVTFINEHVNMPLLNERQEARVIGFAVDILCEIIFDRLHKE
jgi:hypothetical protein